MPHRLRIIVDASLTAGPIAAQAVHAAIAFGVEHPEAAEAWRTSSNTVAILAAPALRLAAIEGRARGRGLLVSRFLEPDLGGALTAIAIEPCPEARKICAGLPLAGGSAASRDVDLAVLTTGIEPA